LLSNI